MGPALGAVAHPQSAAVEAGAREEHHTLAKGRQWSGRELVHAAWQRRERTERTRTQVGHLCRSFLRSVADPQLPSGEGIARDEIEPAAGGCRPLRVGPVPSRGHVDGEARARDGAVASPQLEAVLRVRPGEVDHALESSQVGRGQRRDVIGVDRRQQPRSGSTPVRPPQRRRTRRRFRDEEAPTSHLDGPPVASAHFDPGRIDIRDLDRPRGGEVGTPERPLRVIGAGPHPDERSGAESHQRVHDGARVESGQLHEPRRRTVGPHQGRGDTLRRAAGRHELRLEPEHRARPADACGRHRAGRAAVARPQRLVRLGGDRSREVDPVLERSQERDIRRIPAGPELMDERRAGRRSIARPELAAEVAVVAEKEEAAAGHDQAALSAG